MFDRVFGPCTRASATPHYFDALKREFRCQLTVIGQLAQAINGSVAARDRRFLAAGSSIHGPTS